MSLISSPNFRMAGDWVAGRNPREKLILAVAAIILIVGLFLTFIWRPLIGAREAALDRLDRENGLIAFMRSDGDRLRALSLTAPPISVLPAATAITEEAAAHQITIQRLEHDGNQLRIVLDHCAFSNLILWIGRLETGHGLRLVRLEVDRRPDPGMVSARVTVEE